MNTALGMRLKESLSKSMSTDADVSSWIRTGVAVVSILLGGFAAYVNVTSRLTAMEVKIEEYKQALHSHIINPDIHYQGLRRIEDESRDDSKVINQILIEVQDLNRRVKRMEQKVFE